MPYASARMRQRRQELGIKLQDFAPRVGVSYGHYRNVEYCSKPAAIEVFHRIARELAVPVDELIGADPTKPNTEGKPERDIPRLRDTTAGGSSAEATETSEAAEAETAPEARAAS